MSRTIDPEAIASGELSDDEMLYLAQRDQLPAEVKADFEQQEEIRRRLANISPMLADVPNTGTVNTLGVTIEQLEAMGLEVLEDGANPPKNFQSARLGQRPGDLRGAQRKADLDEAGEDDDDGEEAEADYGSLTNEQLRVELAARDLSTDGNKAEMVARLEEDDASSDTA
jgi:hypothetical protein